MFIQALFPLFNSSFFFFFCYGLYEFFMYFEYPVWFLNNYYWFKVVGAHPNFAFLATYIYGSMVGGGPFQKFSQISLKGLLKAWSSSALGTIPYFSVEEAEAWTDQEAYWGHLFKQWQCCYCQCSSRDLKPGPWNHYYWKFLDHLF